ncbi:MAG: aspartate/glutamate racemase family protein, partial [Duodenibacillus sp.]|nr:aspartate/glutamate racemase family protein [Duodenibacillus sp.]
LKTPFLNMQQVTIDEIKAKLGSEARIGLLATTGTVRTRIYAGKAEAAGLPIFAPDAERQERVMRAIYGPLGVKAGYTEGQCHDDIMAGAEYLVREHGCNVLVLGCTELPLILDEGDMEVAGKTAWVIDPTSALARAAVKMAVAANKERAGK